MKELVQIIFFILEYWSFEMYLYDDINAWKVRFIIWWNIRLYCRFLNDLLDADVLIHIIDASGTTNEKGEETVDYDPANDVQWLKEELQ